MGEQEWVCLAGFIMAKTVNNAITIQTAASALCVSFFIS
jgi:hypothetical protein